MLAGVRKQELGPPLCFAATHGVHPPHGEHTHKPFMAEFGEDHDLHGAGQGDHSNGWDLLLLLAS